MPEGMQENSHLAQNPNLHRTAPGERERVATLSHPVARGDVGERSAPRSCRRKRNPHSNSPSRRQEPASPPKPFPASSETEIPAEPAPGERERVATLSHPVTRGGVGERSAPRPCRRKRNPHPNSPSRRRKPASPPKLFPASSETEIPAEPALCAAENQHLHRSRFLHRRKSKFPSNQPSGERERVATLSHPVTRGSVGERSAPRPRRRKQRPQKDNLLRREPIPPPEQPRESARGCEPSRLPIEAGDLRGGKVACPKGKQVASRPTKRNRRFRLVAPGR